MTQLIILVIFVVIPIWLAHDIAKKRNRTVWKAIVLTILFGWWAVLFLAIGLSTRDPKTGFLK